MKIKLMLSLMLICCSYFTVSAQSYLPSVQALSVIEAELQAWENGTVDVNSINLPQTNYSSQTSDAFKPGTMMNEAAFTGILEFAFDAIKAAMDTQVGMSTVYARFPTNTENQASQALAYVNNLVTN